MYKHIFSSDCLKGNHFFDGKPQVDSAVNLCVDPTQLDSIITYIQAIAILHDGINGVQQFMNTEGDVIVFESFLSKDEYFDLEEDGEKDLDTLNRFHIYFSTAPRL